MVIPERRDNMRASKMLHWSISKCFNFGVGGYKPSLVTLEALEAEAGMAILFEYVATLYPAVQSLEEVLEILRNTTDRNKLRSEFRSALGDEFYLGRNARVIKWLKNYYKATNLVEKHEAIAMHRSHNCGGGDNCENEECLCPCHDDHPYSDYDFYRDVGLSRR